MFIYSYFVQSIIMLYMILIVLWTIVKRLIKWSYVSWQVTVTYTSAFSNQTNNSSGKMHYVCLFFP